MVDKVVLSDEAADWLRRLTEMHGPLMFHQSGGCCDGSSPMCYPDGEFRTGSADVHLGEATEPVRRRIREQHLLNHHAQKNPSFEGL